MHIIIIYYVVILATTKAIEIKQQFKWNYINFTWPNAIDYQYHFQMKDYIPENNIPTKIKLHNNKMYIALGRLYPGTPVTLGCININSVKENPLIIPFPNWEMNNGNANNCTTLQNVNSFEIDENNIMWILDGVRNNEFTNCPAKLVLYNIYSKKIINQYDFPQEPFSKYNLAQIVVDGNFSYISDSNEIDPGIIIYSKNKNKSWKIRDGTMFPELKASTFVINTKKYKYYHPIGPIAISPPSKSKKNRFLFYSPVSSYNLYKLNVKVLQSEELLSASSWREYIHLAGTKVDQSYDYQISSNGDLYFCLLNKNALAKWNIETNFGKASYVATNAAIDWCTGITFGGNYMYMMTGTLGKVLVAKEKPNINGYNYNFQILRIGNGKNKP